MIYWCASYAICGGQSGFVISTSFFDRGDWFFFRLTVQHLHRGGNDLGVVLGFAALIFILVRLQPTFQVDEPALVKKLLADFTQPSPRFHVHPLGTLLVFPLRRFPALAHCQAEMRDTPQPLKRRGFLGQP